MTLEEAKEKFLNKRVRIKDAIGKSSWKGDFPSWELCATIDRFPIQHVKLENIILEPKEN